VEFGGHRGWQCPPRPLKSWHLCDLDHRRIPFRCQVSWYAVDSPLVCFINGHAFERSQKLVSDFLGECRCVFDSKTYNGRTKGVTGKLKLQFEQLYSVLKRNRLIVAY
jgi:hypothetical protein